MITIRVFGTTPPCAKCARAEREALKAARQFPEQVEVRKVDALSPETDAYGMIVTPAVAVDHRIVGSGRVVSAAQLVQHIHSALEG